MLLPDTPPSSESAVLLCMTSLRVLTNTEHRHISDRSPRQNETVDFVDLKTGTLTRSMSKHHTHASWYRITYIPATAIKAGGPVQKPETPPKVTLHFMPQ